jgi:hypothetical protein
MATYIGGTNYHASEASFGLETSRGAFRIGARFMSLMFVDTVRCLAYLGIART